MLARRRQLRQLLLLAVILFLLATAAPESAPIRNAPRRNPQLLDAGPTPFTSI